MKESALQALIEKSVRCGYDASKIVKVAHDYSAGLPEFSFKDKVAKAASAASAASAEEK